MSGYGRKGAGAASPVVRILCVDQSGERGAVSIYRAQILLARLRCPELVGFLRETLEHERRHLEKFSALLIARGGRPCRASAAWCVGGLMLGLLTGLGGRQAVLVCTEAVERTVHRHMVEQIAMTATVDPEVSAALTEILEEEAGHLAFARDRRAPRRLMDAALDVVISGTTERLIRLSTGGV